MSSSVVAIERPIRLTIETRLAFQPTGPVLTQRCHQGNCYCTVTQETTPEGITVLQTAFTTPTSKNQARLSHWRSCIITAIQAQQPLDHPFRSTSHAFQFVLLDDPTIELNEKLSFQQLLSQYEREILGTDQYPGGGILLVQRPLPLTVEKLYQLLSRNGAFDKRQDDTLDVLFDRLKGLPNGSLDVESIRAEPVKSLPHPDDLPVEIIEDRTRELVPCNFMKGGMYVDGLLPDESGVQLKSRFIFHYRIASKDYFETIEAARKKRTDDIAHAKKLLNELPIALKNSQAQLAERTHEADDLSELGAMVVEQKRISDEIKAQKAKLIQLRETPIPSFDSTKLELQTIHSEAKMLFGFNTIQGLRYQLIKKSHPIKIDWVQTSQQ